MQDFQGNNHDNNHDYVDNHERFVMLPQFLVLMYISRI
jgi:hypothetical protein